MAQHSSSGMLFLPPAVPFEGDAMAGTDNGRYYLSGSRVLHRRDGNYPRRREVRRFDFKLMRKGRPKVRQEGVKKTESPCGAGRKWSRHGVPCRSSPYAEFNTTLSTSISTGTNIDFIELADF